jgi:hypothetical protein
MEFENIHEAKKVPKSQWSWKDFQKYAPQDLVVMREKDKKAYGKLFKDYFGVFPNMLIIK